jgi:hypothetical protein
MKASDGGAPAAATSKLASHTIASVNGQPASQYVPHSIQQVRSHVHLSLRLGAIMSCHVSSSQTVTVGETALLSKRPAAAACCRCCSFRGCRSV